MKVRAITEVYYDNKRHKKGKIFHLKEMNGLKLNKMTGKLEPYVWTVKEQFSAKTMECLDEGVEWAEPKHEPKVRKPKTLAQAAKTDRTVVADLEVI